MCTASVLCIGIRGETCPHCDGGQLALGSGNTPCAEAPDQRASVNHISTPAPRAANPIFLLILDLLVLTWNKVAETPRMGAYNSRVKVFRPTKKRAPCGALCVTKKSGLSARAAYSM